MTPSSDSRWNDDRLDDFYEEFRRMVATVERVAVIEEALKSVATDARQCRRSVHTLRSDLGAQILRVQTLQAEGLTELRRELSERDAATTAERKADRWRIIGLVTTVAALLIAAISLALTHF